MAGAGNGGCETNGYGLFAAPVWSLHVGQTSAWSARAGSGVHSQGIAIWIDLNDDGQFESTEQVAVSPTPALGHSGSFIIPATGTIADNVAMRVRCAHDENPAAGQACTNGSYGETEDYRVNIVWSADLSIATTDGVAVATPGGSVTYTITATNAGPDPVTAATVADTCPRPSPPRGAAWEPGAAPARRPARGTSTTP